MTMNQARFGLLGIFVLCLVAQLAAFFSVGYKMWPEDLQSLVVKMVTIYSIHLTVILGGIFAQAGGPLDDPPAPLAWTAIAVALLWNALLIWRSISFVKATADSTSELIKYLDGVSSSSSFLVTGALAFFFTKGAGVAKPRVSSSSFEPKKNASASP